MSRRASSSSTPCMLMGVHAYPVERTLVRGVFWIFCDKSARFAFFPASFSFFQSPLLHSPPPLIASPNLPLHLVLVLSL
ncbi:hypothetical protein BD410DRAFT_787302, partial [Rickenella mellea]